MRFIDLIFAKSLYSLEEGGRKLENRLEAGSMNPTGVGGFSKGQSGNPGGRRKKAAEDIETQQLARQHGATAIDALVKIAIKGKSESARGSAAIACLTEALEKRPSQLKAM